MYLRTEEGLGLGISQTELDRAVQRNRQYARALGWEHCYDRISRLLGFTTSTPDQRFLAEAVARWQITQNLPENGIIDRRTWGRMQTLLPPAVNAIQSASRPSASQRPIPTGKGMFITNLHSSEANPTQMAEKARQNGINWVAIQIISEEGNTVNLNRTVVNNNYEEMVLTRYIAELQRINPSIGIWLWGWVFPGHINQNVSTLINNARMIRALGVIADAEVHWKNRPDNARIFMDQLLAQAQSAQLSVGVTSYGAPWGHRTFPFTAFSRADFGVPQIYHPSLGACFPSRCVREWQAKGFSRVLPVSGFHIKTGDQVTFQTESQVINLLNNTPTPDNAISWWQWRIANRRINGDVRQREYWDLIRRYQIGVGIPLMSV